MKLLFEIIVSFFRIGLFTFGGGYAMLPIAKKEVVDKRAWITNEELIDFYGIAQVSMGIIAINTSVLIGYKVNKKIGGIVAGLSSMVPSIIIILLIALFLDNILTFPFVVNMFSMIRIVVTALIINTTYTLSKKGIKDINGVFIFLVSFVLITFFDLSPIYIVVLSVVAGILLYPKKVKS